MQTMRQGLYGVRHFGPTVADDDAASTEEEESISSKQERDTEKIMQAWERGIEPLQEATAALERRDIDSALRLTADEQHFVVEGYAAELLAAMQHSAGRDRERAALALRTVARCQARNMVLTAGCHALGAWRMGATLISTLRSSTLPDADVQLLMNSAEGRALERRAFGVFLRATKLMLTVLHRMGPWIAPLECFGAESALRELDAMAPHAAKIATLRECAEYAALRAAMDAPHGAQALAALRAAAAEVPAEQARREVDAAEAARAAGARATAEAPQQQRQQRVCFAPACAAAEHFMVGTPTSTRRTQGTLGTRATQTRQR
jgi:hypothetical protein